MTTLRNVFVTGGTGYIGRRVVPELVSRGHVVRALVRAGSEGKLARGCEVLVGSALDGSTFADRVAPSDTFLQLVGTPNPLPAKARQFREVDLVSVKESVRAAARAGIAHFVYVSVAQPAPVMRAYVAVRAEGEAAIRAAGLNATILRPWYVLGPGRRWPVVLMPLYWLAERFPPTGALARRLGLVGIAAFASAVVHALENPPNGVRVVEVPEMKAL